MAMDDVIWAMLTKNVEKVRRESPWPTSTEALEESRPERSYLIIECALRFRLDNKIHTVFITIDISQDVHQPSLRAAIPSHVVHDMENFRHRPPPIGSVRDAMGRHSASLYRASRSGGGGVH